MLRKQQREETRAMSDDTITMTSSAVFGDFGLAEDEERQTKTKLARLLRRAMERQNLNQTEAGKILGLDQLSVSQLVRGKVDGYSTERLISYLTALGCNVHISVTVGDLGHKGGVIFD
jgi:predicted XRE-type DNA-binding protein